MSSYKGEWDFNDCPRQTKLPVTFVTLKVLERLEWIPFLLEIRFFDAVNLDPQGDSTVNESLVSYGDDVLYPGVHIGNVVAEEPEEITGVVEHDGDGDDCARVSLASAQQLVELEIAGKQMLIGCSFVMSVQNNDEPELPV